MIILRDYFGESSEPSAVAIGALDQLYLGHQWVIGGLRPGGDAPQGALHGRHV